MKGIKKILAFSLVAIISMSFFMGCSNRNSDKKVGIVLSTLNNPFFV